MDMDVIRSKDNSKIKYVRSLNNKKNRERDFLIEGYKLVEEAISELNESRIKYILINESEQNKSEFYKLINLLENKKIDYYLCENRIFNSVVNTINSQGILAVAVKSEYRIDDVLNNKFIIMCDRIQDPGNLGTIIRTADAFGPSAVILNRGCVDIYNPKVVRAAAGALFRIPFIAGVTSREIINQLINRGFKIISTVVDSKSSFDNIEKSEKICVVIGNEGQGISQEILENSHMEITIEMTGRLESLNASIAAGISIYEIRKKLL